MHALLDELNSAMPAADRQPDASNPEADCLQAEVQRLRDDLELVTAHGNDLRAQLSRERGVSEALRGELARAKAELTALVLKVQQGARAHNQ